MYNHFGFQDASPKHAQQIVFILLDKSVIYEMESISTIIF